MSELDCAFKAFVTNLGKYNEGELIGKWVSFPSTKEEMMKVFKHIGIGTEDEFGNHYEEYFITDYDCSVHGMYDILGEYENLDKLNYLAALLDHLSSYEQEQFASIMESGCSEVSNIDDLINLTFNLDVYRLMYSVHDDSDLGYYHVHETGIYNEKDFGIFANYIDYESLGRDIRLEEDGQYTNKGYLYSTGDSWDIQFDGLHESIPSEYCITDCKYETDKKSKITILIVEPEKEPYVKEIEAGLHSMQNEVGGYIEAVYAFQDQAAIVCNEEGKLNNLPLNRALRDRNGEIYDIIAGTFMVVGLTEDDFGSLSTEQIKRYTDYYKTPEQFLILGEKIITLPVILDEQEVIKDNPFNNKSTLSVTEKRKDTPTKKQESKKRQHKEKDYER